MCRRGVRVKSQLKSHKRFASAFPTYIQLVDQARLYCTNALEGPPKVPVVLLSYTLRWFPQLTNKLNNGIPFIINNPALPRTSKSNAYLHNACVMCACVGRWCTYARKCTLELLVIFVQPIPEKLNQP